MYPTELDSTSPPKTNGGKLNKVESSLDFGRRLSLPKIYPSWLRLFSYLLRLLYDITYVDYVTREKILGYYLTNPADHDAVHPSRSGRSDLLAPSRRTE